MLYRGNNENDADTFWRFCFCLFCDRDQGQIYEDEEALLCYRDIHYCVSGDNDFGFFRRESLIAKTESETPKDVPCSDVL